MNFADAAWIGLLTGYVGYTLILVIWAVGWAPPLDWVP